VDIAATFASLLGINQPSAAVGHVLTQALRPAAAIPAEPAAPAPAHRATSRRTHPAAPPAPVPDAGSVQPE
jgi:hypothetical protein